MTDRYTGAHTPPYFENSLKVIDLIKVPALCLDRVGLSCVQCVNCEIELVCHLQKKEIPWLWSADLDASLHLGCCMNGCFNHQADRVRQFHPWEGQRRSQTLALCRRWLTSLGLSSLSILGLSGSGLAAERLYITYGPFGQTVSVESIETFARQGKIPHELDGYSGLFNDTQLTEIQRLLLSRANLNHVAIAQFFYSEPGEVLLRRLGEILKTESRQSGFYALRAALIQAADDPEGLTPLNVIKKFPLEGIRVDLEQTLTLVSELENLITETSEATATIERQSAIEAAAEPVTNFDQLPDLRAAGEFLYQKQTFSLNDERRQRNFEADLYLPAVDGNRVVPLIVISHGLGSDRTTYAYLAEQLASYGFAVAVPNHPGSDADQLRALVEGRANDVTVPSEFINRPLDIKFLLDDLERRSQTDPQIQNRIDMQHVGVIGQSFGGYTALALAGAPIDPMHLSEACLSTVSLNLSLLLQCRVQDLLLPINNLKDERVNAIFVINPIGSQLFGKAGFQSINLPVTIVTGNADTIAPSLPEQITPFTWLKSSNKFLLLLRGATHFSTIGSSSISPDVVELPPEVVGPNPALARRYMSAMSVAFFSVYLNQEAEYTVFLGSSYARYISQTNLPLRLIRDYPTAQVAAIESEENLSLEIEAARATALQNHLARGNRKL